jgi:hypothetical protein
MGGGFRGKVLIQEDLGGDAVGDGGILQGDEELPSRQIPWIGKKIAHVIGK